MNKNRTEPSSSSLDNPAKSSRRASSTAGGGDIIVIAQLIFDTIHTLHSPSSASRPRVSCNVCIVSNINWAITITYKPGSVFLYVCYLYPVTLYVS